MINTAVLFGGSGFIGSHLALELLKHHPDIKIYLVDLKQPDFFILPKSLKEAFNAGSLKHIKLDVRDIINHPELPKNPDLIVNLAAVHREPGHEPYEYYETNIPGAKNVCQWATEVGCQTLIFTSSISIYGAEAGKSDAKSEQSKPEPNTPYGLSKLAAERIHTEWQKQDINRKLMIVRPGVIFGAGEKGNVSRMVKAVIGRYFIYTGNQKTRKAGGYVKELCHSMLWALEKLQPGVMVFNFTMNPAPTVQEYAETISKVANLRSKVFNLPFPLLLLGSYGVVLFSKITGKGNGINPTRVKKLLKSNYIVPAELERLGYTYKYSLEQALADWKLEQPKDW